MREGSAKIEYHLKYLQKAVTIRNGEFCLDVAKLLDIYGCTPGVHHVKQCDDMDCTECWERWLSEYAVIEESPVVQETKASWGNWISVKDQLPAPLVHCLVHYETGDIDTSVYSPVNNSWTGECIFGEVTHWMPLPNPPEKA